MTDRPAPRRGELWLARPRTGGPDAIVLVTLVDGPIASVCLTDSETESASDEHMVFARGEAAPWVVRVMFDVVAPVAVARLVRRIGVLPVTDDQLADLTWFEPVLALAHRRGLPLTGPRDPRWAPLVAQAQDFEERFLEPYAG